MPPLNLGPAAAISHVAVLSRFLRDEPVRGPLHERQEPSHHAVHQLRRRDAHGVLELAVHLCVVLMGSPHHVEGVEPGDDGPLLLLVVGYELHVRVVREAAAAEHIPGPELADAPERVSQVRPSEEQHAVTRAQIDGRVGEDLEGVQRVVGAEAVHVHGGRTAMLRLEAPRPAGQGSDPGVGVVVRRVHHVRVGVAQLPRLLAARLTRGALKEGLARGRAEGELRGADGGEGVQAALLLVARHAAEDEDAVCARQDAVGHILRAHHLAQQRRLVHERRVEEDGHQSALRLPHQHARLHRAPERAVAEEWREGGRGPRRVNEARHESLRVPPAHEEETAHGKSHSRAGNVQRQLPRGCAGTHAGRWHARGDACNGERSPRGDEDSRLKPQHPHEGARVAPARGGGGEEPSREHGKRRLRGEDGHHRGEALVAPQPLPLGNGESEGARVEEYDDALRQGPGDRRDADAHDLRARGPQGHEQRRHHHARRRPVERQPHLDETVNEARGARG
mmetsp:Transcript_10538/g.31383  ORF Transcript_10538/g.31383 Transcript_10538/m.31383 type:complete len:508 (+) Transcript_10538:224-1747(+)